MKKIIYIIFTIIWIALAIWLLASYIDVVSNNLCMNPIYQDWNLFEIFF